MSATPPPPPPPANPPMPQQPMGGPAKPDNYLVWAILTTILCCLPFGIVSIVYAAKVDGLWGSGQYEAAEEASRNAKKWAMIAGIVGIIVIVLYIIFWLILVVFAASTDPNVYYYDGR